MRPIKIEAWAIEIVERLKSLNPIEDFRVELKSEWPDPQKAARLIAGHANAARGEPILWLIGVDEDKGLIGASHKELANWFGSVQAEFDGVSPSLLDLNIPLDEKTVVALYFETDRAPYVVKNPSFGTVKGVAISHEVPWREGTSTRSARRSDLIKMLVPILKLPEIDILDGKLTVSLSNDGTWNWQLVLETYITPQNGFTCILPFHQSEGSFEVVNQIETTKFDKIKMFPPYNKYKSGGRSYLFATEPDSLTVGHTQDEAIIEGPGRLNITGEKSTKSKTIDLTGSTAKINFSICPSHSDRRVQINRTLVWEPQAEENNREWVLGKAT